MFTKKITTIFNVTLVLIIILLTLNFFNVQLPNLGKAFYHFDRSPHLCGVDNNGIVLNPDLNRCCFEARNLAKCNQDKHQTNLGVFEISCKNSEHTPFIRLNNKAYYYCLNSDIWS